MTAGFACDMPECDGFTQRLAGAWEHRTYDEHYREIDKFVAHLCGDCAADLSKTLGFRPEAAIDENAA